MKIKTKNKLDSLISINATISWEDIKADFEQVFSDIVANHTPQGGRKGSLAKGGQRLKLFKRQNIKSIEADFIDKKINDYYSAALKESKLVPINQGSIQTIDFKEGKDLKFEIEFEVAPQFKLPNYEKKVNIKTTKYIANNHDVDHAITDMSKQHQKTQEVNRGLQSGDFIYADFTKLDDNNNLVKDSTLKNHYMQIGTGLFVGDLEKPFLKKKKEDSINIIVPQDNKKVGYTVKINKIEEVVLPKIDNKLAKLIDPSIKNLDELKKKVHNNIQLNLDNENKKELQNRILEYFVNKSAFDIPPSMFNKYKEMLDKENEQDPTSKKSDEEVATLATNSVKWYFIREKLIEKNKISLKREDVDKQINEFIEKNGNQKKEIEAFYKKEENINKLAEDLINQKLFDMLDKFFINKVKELSTDTIRKKGK